MKLLKTILLFCCCMMALSANAQYCDTTSFQKIIYNQGIQNAIPKNVFFSAANDIYIIGITQSPVNYSDDIWMMKTTPGGNVIWSKTVGLQKDESLSGIKILTDGSFVVAGSTTSAGTFKQGWLVKTDSDANVEWSVAAGGLYSNLTQVVHLKEGGYAASGTLYTSFTGDSAGNVISLKTSTNLVMRLDENGNLLWYKSFRYSSNEQLKSIIQLKDGNLLVTGAVDNVYDGYLIKLSATDGDILWMNEYKSFNHYSFPHAIEQSDGTIHLHVDNRTYFVTADGKFYDAREIELNSNDLDLNNIQVSDYGALTTGLELYAANLYPQHSPVLFAVQNDSVVIWAHDYQQTPGNLQQIINGRFHKSGIYLAGNYAASNLSDNNAKESLTYLIKADANGETLCSDTFNVSFKINVIPYPPDYTHGFINEGTIQPQFLSPSTQIVTGVIKNDCAVKNCCTALSADTTVTLCMGNNYVLPPNDSLVHTSGIYPFHYYTSRGCDSVYNYNVNFKKLVGFSLDDTCLINNQPVTFMLPADTSISYKWQDGSTSNSFTATVPGMYHVTARSACNIFRDTVNINTSCLPPVYVPSAFTPNGDGKNDVFHVADLNGQRLINLSVYNRYGQHIFNSENNFFGWNGTLNGVAQPTGTYIYTLQYFDLKGAIHSLEGTVVLIR